MSTFTIFPAIDLKGGRCVRLLQGRADAETVYSNDPIAVAQHWIDEGATYLHIVDLDGAFQGYSMQRDLVAKIAKAISIPVQVGGGLRTDEDVEFMLSNGVARAVLGTRALESTEQLSQVVKRFGPQVAVGIDSRDGKVQVKGWTETTGVTAVSLAKQVDQLGVKTLIVTDTATDGMLKGVNAKAIDDICAAVSCSVIASGGVTSVDDIKVLRALKRPNLIGAIVGKALYEGRVKLAELIVAAN